MTETWTYAAHGPSLHRKTHEEICQLCLQAGFSGIEGHMALFQGMAEGELSEVGRLYRAAGLKIDSFHLPYGGTDDIASFDETIRAAAVEKMKTWLRHASLLGARVAIQHPTTNPRSVREAGLDAYLRTLDRSLSELLPLAESLKIIIALENLPPRDGERFSSRPEHIVAIRQKFSHSALGFCLDTGHALISLHAAASEMADAMKPQLQAFHLVDNAGDRDSHLAPGRGSVNWSSISQLMGEIGFSHAACIEAPPFAFGPDYSDSAWGDLLKSTRHVLRPQAGI